jgi:hypothetical protein
VACPRKQYDSAIVFTVMIECKGSQLKLLRTANRIVKAESYFLRVLQAQGNYKWEEPIGELLKQKSSKRGKTHKDVRDEHFLI